MANIRARAKQIIEEKNRRLKEEKGRSRRSKWTLGTQIASTIILAGIAAIALWVTIRQLNELRRRPFLSLCFAPFSDYKEGEIPYTYWMFYEKERIMTEHRFSLGIMNSGNKSSRGGRLLLGIPHCLNVKIESFRF